MAEYAARRGSARLPINATAQIRYPGVDDVFENQVGDVGLAGMFIATESPMPAGTLMHFELRPSAQWKALQGRGRVVWARHQPSPGGNPAGMGVRFVELDELSRRGVRWLIETYQEVGDKPFESWTVPQQFTRSTPAGVQDMHATQRIEPLPAQVASEPRSKRSAWPLLAACLAAIVLAGWLFVGNRDRAVESASAPASLPPSSATAATAGPVAKTNDEIRSAAEPAGSMHAVTLPASDQPLVIDQSPTEIEPVALLAAEPETKAAVAPVVAVAELLSERVAQWAAAWSSQDVDSYLEFYAPDFVPGHRLARTEWARQRRERVAAPGYVRIGLDGVQVLDPDSEAPRTVFTQSYESDTFADEVTKSLTWSHRDDAWRIVSERSAP